MAKLTTNLKVLLLNTENLFLLSDQKLTAEHLNLDEAQWKRLSTSIYENKPLIKTKALAQAIKKHNPDILMLIEVGGLESLQNFNKLFLDDTYSPALIEGNSDRHIDVGFLVRKNIGFYFDVVSNKNRPINFLYSREREAAQNNPKAIQSHKFSRDAAELHLFTKDREKPFMIFVLAHLKSRLDPDNVDPGGFERRQAELKTLIEIYQELEAKHHNIPICVSGDLNGRAAINQPDTEFKLIYEKTLLKDVGDLAQLPEDQRATYYQIGRNSKPEGKQLDYCFLNPKLAELLNTQSVLVHRYEDHLGLPFDPPTTLGAKTNLPSDHYPLIFEIQNLVLT